MYLHLGQESSIRTADVVGIFDLDNASTSKETRAFLARAQKEGRVVNVSPELPRSFLVSAGKEKKVYICQLSAATLKKRSRVK